MDLSTAEIRVLGCLLEKQRTTPDHYPLSLNSLRLACNQSTNREPVVGYDDAIVRDALHRLERRGFTRLAGRGSRAAKYRHLLSQALPMTDAEQAVVCVLMLRGPQTPGELKQRGERMHAFESLEEVHATLATLIERGLVARQARRPGQKEERYTQLLGDSSEESPNGVAASSVSTPQPLVSTQQPLGSTRQSLGSTPQPLGSTQQPLGSAPQSLGSTPQPVASVPAPDGPHDRVPAPDDLHDRVARLEREVAELRVVLAQPSQP